MPLNRRSLMASGAAALAFSGLGRHALAAAQETYVNEVTGYGPLKADPPACSICPRASPIAFCRAPAR